MAGKIASSSPSGLDNITAYSDIQGYAYMGQLFGEVNGNQKNLIING